MGAGARCEDHVHARPQEPPPPPAQPPQSRRRAAESPDDHERDRDMKLISALAAVGPLLAPSGKPITDMNAMLTGKRVGLYFSAGWCPMCTSFEPSLLNFREAAAQSGKPVELLYVSSDRSERDALARASGLGMTAVPFNHVDALKKEHQVWAGAETMKLGFGRRSGVPAIIILSSEGEEAGFVDAEARGAAALAKWDLDSHVL